MVEPRHELLDLLRTRSLRRGDFVLASGRRSTYYIDCRLTTMSGPGQRLIGQLGLALLEQHGWHPDCVGGLTLGADPVAYAIAHTAALAGRSLDAFTVRKEAKGHGTGRLIEGADLAGRSVVIVEDVITTGGSALQAIAATRTAGARVLGVVAVVDRNEGGRQRLEADGWTVLSLTTAEELLA
ncbi:MAG: orotate phosphoribosyltransferase [Gemmatimonadetes bacterium]|nr:orotate phosphoribosyltransferase [Gemmatimonadota bacterium]